MMLSKWCFHSIPQLCEKIEQKNIDLKESIDKLENLMPKIEKGLSEIKDISPEFSKLKVQVANLKEYRPKLHDMYEEAREAVLDLNNSIKNNLDNSLDQIDKGLDCIKSIMFSADCLILKEEKLLNGFAKKINAVEGDDDLKKLMINKINLIKEDIKSITRRLFEKARAEQDDIFDKQKKTKLPLSEEIKRLSVEIDSVGRVLERLNIDDIDEITKDCEKEIDDIEKIEEDVMDMVNKIESYLKKIQGKLHLLEDDISDKLRQRVDDSYKKLEDIKADITNNAKKIFESVVIFQEVDVVK